MTNELDALLGSANAEVYRVQTKAPGPSGSLPLTAEMLRERPSGDIFGLTQNAGMGWNPAELGRKQFLILSTQGGLRAEDGSPIALGYHTGHWEISACSCSAAAEELKRLKIGVPSPAHVLRPVRRAHAGNGRGCSTACRIATTPRIVFRRLIRSLPTRSGRRRRGDVRQGPARDDDGARRECATCRACWCRAA